MAKDTQSRLFLLALSGILIAMAQFFDTLFDVEKKTTSFAHIDDPDNWSKVFKDALTTFSKDDFQDLMGVAYLLGKMEATNVYKLSQKEKKDFVAELRESSLTLKRILKESKK